MLEQNRKVGINISVPNGLIERIDQKAKENNITRSKYILDLVVKDLG